MWFFNGFADDNRTKSRKNQNNTQKKRKTTIDAHTRNFLSSLYMSRGGVDGGDRSARLYRKMRTVIKCVRTFKPDVCDVRYEPSVSLHNCTQCE